MLNKQFFFLHFSDCFSLISSANAFFLLLNVNRKTNEKCKCSPTVVLIAQRIDIVDYNKNFNEKQRERIGEWNTGEFFSRTCLAVMARSYFLHLVCSFSFLIVDKKGILALRNATTVICLILRLFSFLYIFFFFIG